MKYINNIIPLFALIGLLSSCKPDPIPYTNTPYDDWSYTGGDATIRPTEYAEINFDIQNSLNVNGSADIVGELSIQNDLNLNNGGKVIIDIPSINDTIYVNGNININDSLIILNAHVVVYGEINLNFGGVLNVGDYASVYIQNDINQSGYLYGNRNVSNSGSHYQNNGSITQEAPLYSTYNF